jgi:uncharacterized membrane protein YccF (DUF307 family)
VRQPDGGACELVRRRSELACVAALRQYPLTGLGKGLWMRVVLNIVWLVFSGIWLFIAYVFAAILSVVFIITIPFGIASLRIAFYALWPFGRTVVKKQTAGAGSIVGNILWFVLGGWYLTLMHIITGVLLCLTVIGIPLGLGNFKMIKVSLMPFGHEIVSNSEAHALQGAEHHVAISA